MFLWFSDYSIHLDFEWGEFPFPPFPFPVCSLRLPYKLAPPLVSLPSVPLEVGTPIVALATQWVRVEPVCQTYFGLRHEFAPV